MTTRTEVRAKMVAKLDAATDNQLVEMHSLAFNLLRNSSLDESPAITTAMAAIETQFERRGIAHCTECGCPNGHHEPDFCSLG